MYWAVPRGRHTEWLTLWLFLLPQGSTVYTCMLNHRGGTESDLTVSRLDPSPQASALAPAFEGRRSPPGRAVL